MGGGVGLSVHGRYKIATDTTVLAMPETAIGLFPDVGASYVLSHMRNPLIGLYVGLTGDRLNGADVYMLGLATHYVPKRHLHDLITALKTADLKGEAFQTVEEILTMYSSEPEIKPTITYNKALQIERFLGQSTCLKDLILKLSSERQHDQFANQSIQKLERMCPLGCAVWWHAFHRGRDSSLKQCFNMEYNLMEEFVLKKDTNFREGVTALLIDKTNNPIWTPSRHDEVDDELVEKMFSNMSQKVFDD